MRKKSDERQRQIVDFLNEQIKSKGYPPSVREICKALGLKSTSTVHGYLEKLAQNGVINKNPSTPRALRVLNNTPDSTPSHNINQGITDNTDDRSNFGANVVSIEGGKTSRKGIADNQSPYFFKRKEMVDIPIIGRVTAGQPILAVENVEDSFPVPVEYTQNATSFMLRVRGDSMIDAGILDNDLVLVRQQNTAYNGEIVVALIGDEATVKTFYKETDHIRLQPENKYLDPILVKDGVSVLGKVVGVFRKI